MSAAQQPEPGGHSVHKIGGTSMAEVDAVMDNIIVGERRDDALYNRIFVVSAYGGFTDLLLENKKTHESGVFQLYAGAESDWAWGDALSGVAEKMHALNAEIFDNLADRNRADAFVKERIEGTRSCLVDLHRLCSFGHFKLEEHLMTVREMLSAIGEAHSAHNTVLRLNAAGVNAVLVDLSGWREPDSLALDERIEAAFAGIDLTRELPIVTGYAQCRDGLMRRYGRGYSEVTFSRVACLTGAGEAVIHKEYHLSSGDPKIVGADKVRPIGRTNYDVADQLSNMGMEAIHPRAAKGLRQNGIPLRIANTFEPAHPGTRIEDHWDSDQPRVEIVTGIPAAIEIEVFDQDVVGQPGAEDAVLAALKRFRIATVTQSRNANTVTHYVVAPLKQVRRAIDAIAETQPDARVRTQKVSIVSVIGANLAAPGIFAEAVAALAQADLPLIASHNPSRGVDIQFVLPEDAYAKAVQVLHRQLVETKPAEAGSPAMIAA